MEGKRRWGLREERGGREAMRRAKGRGRNRRKEREGGRKGVGGCV